MSNTRRRLTKCTTRWGNRHDESKIIQLLCNKTPEQIEEFKFRYQMKYTEMLKDRLKVETTGIFENKYFREMIQGLLTNREEQLAT